MCRRAVLRDGGGQAAERLAAAGITNLVRSGGWALAPILAGALMQKVGLGAPLIIAGAAKIAYDLMLWIDFRRVKPPEECETVAQSRAVSPLAASAA